MEKETQNIKLVSAIEGIVDALNNFVNSESSDEYPSIKIDPLKKIIDDYDEDNVLSKASYSEVKAQINLSIEKANIEDITAINFVHSNSVKGIGLVKRSQETVSAVPVSSGEVVVKMAPLENNALKYRYNNDKDIYL